MQAFSIKGMKVVKGEAFQVHSGAMSTNRFYIDAYCRLPMAFIYWTKEQAGKINFGCWGKEDTMCVATKVKNSRRHCLEINPNNLKMCCCSSCKYHFGYLNQGVIHKDDIPTYRKLWNKELGFWTEKGCALPYKLRSPTCVSYRCGHVQAVKTLSNKDRFLLEAVGVSGKLLTSALYVYSKGKEWNDALIRDAAKAFIKPCTPNYHNIVVPGWIMAELTGGEETKPAVQKQIFHKPHI